jgi:hypothetical protein
LPPLSLHPSRRLPRRRWMFTVSRSRVPLVVPPPCDLLRRRSSSTPSSRRRSPSTPPFTGLDRQPSPKIRAFSLYRLVWRGGRTNGGVGFRTGLREPAVNRILKVRLCFEEALMAVRSPKVRPHLKEALAAAWARLVLELVSPAVWSRPVTPVVLGDDPLDRWRSSLFDVSLAAQQG